LQNVFPGAQMPPHVRVQRFTHGHREEGNGKQGHKQAFGIQKTRFSHYETRYQETLSAKIAQQRGYKEAAVSADKVRGDKVNGRTPLIINHFPFTINN